MRTDAREVADVEAPRASWNLRQDRVIWLAPGAVVAAIVFAVAARWVTVVRDDVLWWGQLTFVPLTLVLFTAWARGADAGASIGGDDVPAGPGRPSAPRDCVAIARASTRGERRCGPTRPGGSEGMVGPTPNRHAVATDRRMARGGGTVTCNRH